MEIVQVIGSDGQLIGLYRTSREDYKGLQRDVDAAIIQAIEASPRGEAEQYLLDEALEEYDLHRVFATEILTDKL